MTRTVYLRHSALIVALCLGRMTASAATTWTRPFPGGLADTGRAGHASVYDSGTNTMIVFGGFDALLSNNPSTNDVVLLSNANGLGGTPNWEILIANGLPSSPPARSGHVAAYDQSTNRMMVFGGATWLSGNSNPETYLNDVWVLTHANGQGGTPLWTQLSPSGTLPPARYGHSAVYDSTNNRLIIYGGTPGATTFTDVWVLSNANGLGGTPVWQQLSPSGGHPNGGYGASAVYDPSNNIMTVFGGYFQTALSPIDFVLYNSVWTLSHANGLGGTPHWTNILANNAPGSPAKRNAHTAVYDATNNLMTIFGGGSQTATEFPEFSDVWVLANANGLGGTPLWTQLHPGGTQPGRRYSHTAVYDVVGNRMILFAGDSSDAQFSGVWVLTGANGRP